MVMGVFSSRCGRLASVIADCAPDPARFALEATPNPPLNLSCRPTFFAVFRSAGGAVAAVQRA